MEKMQPIRQCDITSCLQDVDEASLTRVHLERRIESLQEEMLFLRRTHDQVENQNQAEPPSPPSPVTDALPVPPPGSAGAAG